jgi:hypothetical protein
MRLTRSPRDLWSWLQTFWQEPVQQMPSDDLPELELLDPVLPAPLGSSERGKPAPTLPLVQTVEADDDPWKKPPVTH